MAPQTPWPPNRSEVMIPIDNQRSNAKHPAAITPDRALARAQTRRPAQVTLAPEGRAARAWVGVVSRTHVQRGVLGGFAQVCHGKRSPLDRMRDGDALVYYSPT